MNAFELLEMKSTRDLPNPVAETSWSMPSRGLAFGCQGCHCHDFEAGIHWCWNGKTRSYRNVKFIISCHLQGGKS